LCAVKPAPLPSKGAGQETKKGHEELKKKRKKKGKSSRLIIALPGPKKDAAMDAKRFGWGIIKSASRGCKRYKMGRLILCFLSSREEKWWFYSMFVEVGYRSIVSRVEYQGLSRWGTEDGPPRTRDFRSFFQKSMASTTSSPRSSSYANNI
jgi:hypothetical protein